MRWPGKSKHTSHEHLSSGQAHLLHDISQLFFNLLLRALEPLPQIIAHAAPLQQNLKRLLRVPDLHNAVDVLGCAAQ